ncbi:MAG: hypothetical protein ACK5MN_03820 [Lachnospiraceae bacterium]
MKKEILRVENAGIVQNGSAVLEDVFLQVCEGDITGIVSDNLRSKEKLELFLRGDIPLTEGKVYLLGEKLPAEKQQGMLREKIFFVEKLKGISEELTGLDFVRIHISKMKKFPRRKKPLLSLVGMLCKKIMIPELVLDKKMKQFTILEICELLLICGYLCGARVFVLLDISNFLNESDKDKFAQMVLRFRERKMAFLVFDHEDSRFLLLAERISVLQQGHTLFVFDRDEYIQLYEGRNGRTRFSGRESAEERIEGSLLAFQDVRTETLSSLTFSIAKGDIVSILDESGYPTEDVIRLLNGSIAPVQGDIYFKGSRFTAREFQHAIPNGICCILENPTKKDKMLFHNLSVLENLSLVVGQKLPGTILAGKSRKSLEAQCREFWGYDICAKSISDLSDVEKQKLVYFKWLLYFPSLVICIRPFSGTDKSMREVTEMMIKQYAQKGIAVLIITSNTGESEAMGGRVIRLKDNDK